MTLDRPLASLPHGRIRDRPEDFVVDEMEAYAPSGQGTHVFVKFTKTRRTTLEALGAIARALSCDPRSAGYAGMKDKHAVTTQTLSLQAKSEGEAIALAEKARGLSLDGITIHGATPHGNKLKPGHLAGNRFVIVVRGIDPERLGEVTGALDRVAREGVPNAFGAQRFGAGASNPARALAWLRGQAPGPRDPRVRRLLWSALQSSIFNALLDERVRDGSWATPIEGDLLKLHASGGLFVCTAVQTDRERAVTGEVSPTGPLIGARMRWPGGAVEALERRIVDEHLGTGVDLAATRRLGEGSRRALRLWVEDLRWETVEQDGGTSGACLRVYFVLPKGAYATTVLSAALALEDAGVRDGGSASENGASEQAADDDEEEAQP